ncbi:MAG: hypothetical protein AB8B92_06995, partial [Gammaproteobacteria bacterium]
GILIAKIALFILAIILFLFARFTLKQKRLPYMDWVTRENSPDTYWFGAIVYVGFFCVCIWLIFFG